MTQWRLAAGVVRMLPREAACDLGIERQYAVCRWTQEGGGRGQQKDREKGIPNLQGSREEPTVGP